MNEPIDSHEFDEIERVLRAGFHGPRPHPDFVTTLERQIEARTARELDQESRRRSVFGWLSRPARVAAQGFLALLLALALVWGINNLIPGEAPASREDRLRRSDPLPTPDPATLQAIQSVLDRAAQAHRQHDTAAYQALLDPQAEPEWAQSSLDRIQTVISPLPEAVLIERAVVVRDLAMVLALVESEEAVYTIGYLRNTGDGGWKLTSAVPETWGDLRAIRLEHLTLNYYAFDEPYVMAVVSRVGPALDSLAQDFGVNLKGEPPLDLTLVPSEGPKSFWERETGDRLIFIHSLLLDQAESLEDYLAWGLYDRLARMLVARRVGASIMEERWSNIAEALVLWEVFRARGEPSREEILRYVQSPDAPLALAYLLDTGPYDPHDAGERAQAQVALITFITETYGRQVLPGFLGAIFTQPGWQDVVRASIGADAADFQQRWEKWAKSH